MQSLIGIRGPAELGSVHRSRSPQRVLRLCRLLRPRISSVGILPSLADWEENGPSIVLVMAQAR